MEYAFISFLVLGILTSATDIGKGKIKNSHLILFFLISIASLTPPQKEYIASNIFPLILLWCTVTILGYSLWKWEWWGAGDGKLFTTYAIILPVLTLTTNQAEQTLDFLINSIVPGASIILLHKVMSKQEIWERPDPKTLAKRSLRLTVSYITLSWITILLPKNFPALISLCIITGALLLAERYAQYTLTTLFTTLSAVRLFIDSTLYTASWWITLVITVGILLMVLHIKSTSKKEEHFPFAPILFAGALLTWWLGTNILNVFFFAIATWCINTSHTTCGEILKQTFI